jgi:hypothetical protein
MKLHPKRALSLMSTFAALLLALVATGHRSNAQDSARPAPKGAEDSSRLAAKEDAQARRLEEMRQTARQFQAASIQGGTRTPVALVRDALHRWNDPTREFSDGTLWVWRSTGRPIAALAIELYPEKWALEFVSLSNELVEAADDQVRWTPRTAGVTFREIPDAPAPAAGEAERLRQMRDLLKRFSAREFWDVTSQHYALRLLAHPIDRYADADAGLVDGAIFMFANGTNPEVLLLIEARRQGNGPMSWSYAAAPLTTAAPTLRLDRTDVWTSANKYGHLTNGTYFFVKRARKPSISSPVSKPAQ